MDPEDPKSKLSKDALSAFEFVKEHAEAYERDEFPRRHSYVAFLTAQEERYLWKALMHDEQINMFSNVCLDYEWWDGGAVKIRIASKIHVMVARINEAIYFTISRMAEKSGTFANITGNLAVLAMRFRRWPFHFIESGIDARESFIPDACILFGWTWIPQFITEIAVGQDDDDIYRSVFRCLWEQNGDIKTALVINLGYDKDRIDQPIGCGDYGILRYENLIIQREVLDIVQFRNSDGTCRNPEMKLGIKLSDLIPDGERLLDSDDFVFDVTHKQLNDLVDQGQDWEQYLKQRWNEEREDAASPEYEVTDTSPDDSDLDDDASSESESGYEMSPCMSDSDSTKKRGTEVEDSEVEDSEVEDSETEDSESEDVCAPCASAAEREAEHQCRDTAHHADHNEKSVSSSKDRGSL
jgi:hypothetical protein